MSNVLDLSLPPPLTLYRNLLDRTGNPQRNLVELDALGAGSASGSGPRVGEWLCNHLGLVLVHDISDVRFLDHGHSEAV